MEHYLGKTFNKHLKKLPVAIQRKTMETYYRMVGDPENLYRYCKKIERNPKLMAMDIGRKYRALGNRNI